ncbi:MAG: hypothetical protein ACOYPR_12660, partial [Saprospiraceae bacterium]
FFISIKHINALQALRRAKCNNNKYLFESTLSYCKGRLIEYTTQERAGKYPAFYLDGKPKVLIFNDLILVFYVADGFDDCKAATDFTESG